MQKDKIISVEIDNTGRLYIQPEKSNFSLVSRTATGVHWDKDKLTLYAQRPREWTYLEWFIHIVSVIKTECFTELELTETTEWVNIPDELKHEIRKVY
ncbi:hypothetical protein [Robertkochia solimangrovi]|uniref:hypothetical protein n=1 Tax=Robertkochia solimangrovi TaxID=2213046 RepID=UPI00117E2FDF|nr:hypothetical protein [Robertkochia solimangrovi]TRZ42440.1 hypothetical protein DMZ48_13070 [Robertkochia solimangrovi]